MSIQFNASVLSLVAIIMLLSFAYRIVYVY